MISTFQIAPSAFPGFFVFGRLSETISRNSGRKGKIPPAGCDKINGSGGVYWRSRRNPKGGRFMKQTVYIDVLVLVNLLVNYFLLLLVRSFLHVQAGRGRLFLGALAGALGSLVILLPQPHWSVGLFYRLALSAVMTAVCFCPVSPRLFWKLMGLLYLAAFGFAGFMLALWAMGQSSGLLMNNGILYLPVSPMLLPAAGGGGLSGNETASPHHRSPGTGKPFLYRFGAQRQPKGGFSGKSGYRQHPDGTFFTPACAGGGKVRAFAGAPLLFETEYGSGKLVGRGAAHPLSRGFRTGFSPRICAGGAESIRQRGKPCSAGLLDCGL